MPALTWELVSCVFGMFCAQRSVSANLVPVTSAWRAFRRDFAVSLKAENKSANTQRLYLGAVDKLAAWAEETGAPGDPTKLTRADLSAFMAAMTAVWKPATCSVVFPSCSSSSGG